jgi:hypothetical protein
MGRAAVVAAVIAALAGAALPACDLVFAPGKGPNATDDGPVGIDDSAHGGDGTTAIDAAIDSQLSTLDASVDADTCSFTCYTVDLGPGDPNPAGMARCEFTDDDQCTQYPELVPIDVCTCSVGQPEIYFENLGVSARIAFVGPAPAMSWSITPNNNGSCTSGYPGCTHDGPCFPGTPLWVWDNVPISPSGINQFEFFNDDGAGCTNGAVYTFTIFL